MRVMQLKTAEKSSYTFHLFCWSFRVASPPSPSPIRKGNKQKLFTILMIFCCHFFLAAAGLTLAIVAKQIDDDDDDDYYNYFSLKGFTAF